MTKLRTVICLLSIAVASTGVAQPATDVAAIRSAAHVLTGERSDYDALLDITSAKRFVLLGEASHGTSEFYRERSRITQRLVAEHAFRGVALEANWSDVRQLDRYIAGENISQTDAFAEFTDFPQWTWRNSDFAAFVRFLRTYNATLRPGEPRVHIFGMDLYGVTESADAVVAYLRETDPAAAASAEQRYACFNPYREDMMKYASALQRSDGESCQAQSLAQFDEIQRRYELAPEKDERLFNAVQDARAVKNGEAYYREGAVGTQSTWNIRDTHMADVLDAIAQQYDSMDVAVWAHNTHVGDARATDSNLVGELSLGQIVRERFPQQSVHIGFTMDSGTVMAARDWDQPGEVRTLNPALSSSDAGLFHSTGIGNFYLMTREPALQRVTAAYRYQRAIGVVYAPETEFSSHYFQAQLASQFDVVIHIDSTTAVTPDAAAVGPRRRAAGTLTGFK